MSDKMRWRYGDANPVVAAVDSDTVIEIGDMVLQDADDAKPFATACFGSRAFRDKFLGVAMQRSRSGDTVPIRVAITGVFEFDCPSGTFELGDMMAACANQRVEKTNDRDAAIGRIAKRQPTSVTSVLVDIHSTIMTGGV